MIQFKLKRIKYLDQESIIDQFYRGLNQQSKYIILFHRIGTSRRQDLNQTIDVPGPGQYKPREKQTGPCWGFGSSKRPPLNPKNETPGPGGYD